MPKILIIYPHWMPSNLVGAQRGRLLANSLPELGWETHVLAVHPNYYEEPSVPELTQLVKPQVKVHFVDAKPITKKNRLIGDLALRAFSNLKHKAIDIIRQERIDFFWLPIPSYYNALLGNPIYKATKIPFGIDYIDPWVDGFPGQEKTFSKAWVANKIAKILEPIALKNASLISGVAYEYYAPVLKRNFTKKSIEHCAMQYGFDPFDYTIDIGRGNELWPPNKEAFIYAGAFLPKAHLFIKALFQSVSQLKKENKIPENLHLYFIGTGQYRERSIEQYAIDFGIKDMVTEKRDRISYLQVINLLKKAKGILVIGSTEKHYTASKVFQSLLSGTPIFSIFHQQSDATAILNQIGANNYLVEYNPADDSEKLMLNVKYKFEDIISSQKEWNPNLSLLDQYSAKASAQKLIQSIEKVI
nr:hypothetical protein [uncultured Carboxylicivirga sp.]